MFIIQTDKFKAQLLYNKKINTFFPKMLSRHLLVKDSTSIYYGHHQQS